MPEQSMHEYVVEQLLERQKNEGRSGWDRVARETDISRRTIEKIARGEIEDPGIRKMQILADYFRQPPRRLRGSGSRQLAAS